MNLAELICLLGILVSTLTGLISGSHHGIWLGIAGTIMGFAIGYGSIAIYQRIDHFYSEACSKHPLSSRRFEEKYKEWIVALVFLLGNAVIGFIYLCVIGSLSGLAEHYIWKLISK